MALSQDDAGLYIVIRAETPSPVIPRRCIAAISALASSTACASRSIARIALGWRTACGQFGGCGSLRDAVSTDTDCGSFQRMRQRGDRGRLASAHTRHQQFGLPLEQLQDFPFQAAVVEGHARQVRAIEHGISVRRPFRSKMLTAPCAIPASRELYLFSGTLT